MQYIAYDILMFHHFEEENLDPVLALHCDRTTPARQPS